MARRSPFTAGLALVTGLLFGLWPAWQAAGAASLADALAESTPRRERRTAGGARAEPARYGAGGGWRSCSLAAAGLLIRSLHNAQNARLGFRPEACSEPLSPCRNRATTRQRRRSASSISWSSAPHALPGVTRAAIVALPPLFGIEWKTRYHVTGMPEPPPGRDHHRGRQRRPRPAPSRRFGIPILRGRDFTDEDRAGAPLRVIVDEAFARKHFPERGPDWEAHRQQRHARRAGDPSAPPMTIIGVVPSVRTPEPGPRAGIRPVLLCPGAEPLEQRHPHCSWGLG